MIKVERHALIEKELREHGNVLVSAISELCGCSEETIRRDIKELDSQNKLVKIHGGAYLPEEFNKGYPVELRQILYKEEKKAMANKAIEFIEDNMTLMLDSSTTCLTLLEALLHTEKPVTVITNSLLACNLVNAKTHNLNLICAGGKLCKLTASFTGYRTTALIKQSYADIAFISPPAVDPHFGLSDNEEGEGEVRKAMLEQSRQKILLMDDSKIGQVANKIFYRLEEVNMMITHKPLPSTWQQICQNSLKVVYV